jgi:hypothetical protein
MLTKLQLTSAQRRIRESAGKRSSHTARIAHHRIQLPRVHESLVRLPDQPRSDHQGLDVASRRAGR